MHEVMYEGRDKDEELSGWIYGHRPMTIGQWYDKSRASKYSKMMPLNCYPWRYSLKFKQKLVCCFMCHHNLHWKPVQRGDYEVCCQAGKICLKKAY